MIYSTDKILVKDLEELLTNYEKGKSVAEQMGNALHNYVCRLAIYNVAPTTHTINTPVLTTTGVETDHGLALTYSDVLRLKLAFDKLNIPTVGRVIVLSPDHQSDLLREDVTRYNQD